MDYRSLSNVLGILRLIKANNDSNRSAADLIRDWANPQKSVVSDAAILKVASYIQEQTNEAKIVIANSQLTDEAKHGVHDGLNSIASAFSLSSINAPISNSLGNVTGSISNFVILLSASGVETDPQAPQEAADLAAEVEGLIPAFDDGDLDPIVRELAKQHLQVLATMLRHIPIFGLEAAMTTYFELVTKVRRADANTSAAQKKKVEPLMEKISGWGKVFTAIDKAWNQGARWIARGKVGLMLLGFVDPTSAA